MRQKIPHRLLHVIALLCTCCASLFSLGCHNSLASTTEQKLQGYVESGCFMVAGTDNLLQYRENESFIPASTIKLLTSYLALKKLGPNYRFKTHFYLDQDNNLFIKGFGDPYLVSEEVRRVVAELQQLGIKRLKRLIFDDSAFSLVSQADGLKDSENPYDAPNGALAVNFNSVPVIKTPKGVLQSAENQTPTLPIMHEVAGSISPGIHRINVSKFAPHSGTSPSLRYVGELFTAIFAEHSLTVDNDFISGPTPPNLALFYKHENSKKLTEIIEACLLYSNNFIANQLFLTVGAKEFGLPATWLKAQKALSHFAARERPIHLEQMQIKEGSGLSRSTRISCNQFIDLLVLFRPYADLLPSKGKVLVKSGTLQGVYNYAGYLSKENNLIPFTIFLNQSKNLRDHLLNSLKEEVENW